MGVGRWRHLCRTSGVVRTRGAADHFCWESQWAPCSSTVPHQDRRILGFSPASHCIVLSSGPQYPPSTHQSYMVGVFSYLIICKNIYHIRLVTGNLYEDIRERSNQAPDNTDPSWHVQNRNTSVHPPGPRSTVNCVLITFLWLSISPSESGETVCPSHQWVKHQPALPPSAGGGPAAWCSPSAYWSVVCVSMEWPRHPGRLTAPGKWPGPGPGYSWPALTGPLHLLGSGSSRNL